MPRALGPGFWVIRVFTRPNGRHELTPAWRKPGDKLITSRNILMLSFFHR